MTDQRVTMAAEFLAGARKRRVAELPPSVLMREDAELRRLLGQVLDYAAEHEAEEQGHGARISPGDVLVLGQALTDAVAYRDPVGPCPDCERAPAGLCDDHLADAERVAAYVALASELGIDVGPGGAS